MKIGIMGAQSTGKTTLLNALRSESLLRQYKVCNEVTRKVKAAGFPINEDGTRLTQRQIVLEHFYNLLMHDNMITDRTLVDAHVYTLSLYKKAKTRTTNASQVSGDLDLVDPDIVDITWRAMIRNVHMYDILFFIRPEFDIEDDDVRSTDVAWQRDIDSTFVNVINSNAIKYTRLTGSVSERVEQAMKVIRKKIEEMQ